jgi:hypothetical protein
MEKKILKVTSSFSLFSFVLGRLTKRRKREVRGLKNENERTDEMDFGLWDPPHTFYTCDVACGVWTSIFLSPHVTNPTRSAPPIFSFLFCIQSNLVRKSA